MSETTTATPETPAATPALPKLENQHTVLVLQHPQEKREALSTAPLLEQALSKSVRKVGLSWPNFKKALGRDSMPGNWLVLFVGTKKEGLPVSRDMKTKARAEGKPLVCLFDKKGKARLANKEELAKFEGVVVIDGTWKQAKTMWWRNAWLLKLQRAMVIAPELSIYGDARKEPRPECVSSLEAVAWTLSALGEPAAIQEGLKSRFADLLKELNVKPRLPKKPGVNWAAKPGEKPAAEKSGEKTAPQSKTPSA